MAVKIVEAEAEYTGGGIWIFAGKLSDGKYFYLSTADNYGWYVDEDPIPYFASADADITWIPAHTNDFKNVIPDKLTYELFYKVILFVGDDCDLDPKYYYNLWHRTSKVNENVPVKQVVNKILEGADVREALGSNEYVESGAPDGLLIINQYGDEADNVDDLEVIGDCLLSNRLRPHSNNEFIVYPGDKIGFIDYFALLDGCIGYSFNCGPLYGNKGEEPIIKIPEFKDKWEGILKLKWITGLADIVQFYGFSEKEVQDFKQACSKHGVGNDDWDYIYVCDITLGGDFKDSDIVFDSAALLKKDFSNIWHVWG